MALASGVKDEVAFRDLDKLLVAAKRTNIAVKVSALSCYTDAPYPYRNLHIHVRRVYDAFGPQRMMWGSDLSRLRGTYRECVTLFTEEMGWLYDVHLHIKKCQLSAKTSHLLRLTRHMDPVRRCVGPTRF